MLSVSLEELAIPGIVFHTPTGFNRKAFGKEIGYKRFEKWVKSDKPQQYDELRNVLPRKADLRLGKVGIRGVDETRWLPIFYSVMDDQEFGTSRFSSQLGPLTAIGIDPELAEEGDDLMDKLHAAAREHGVDHVRDMHASGELFVESPAPHPPKVGGYEITNVHSMDTLSSPILVTQGIYTFDLRGGEHVELSYIAQIRQEGKVSDRHTIDSLEVRSHYTTPESPFSDQAEEAQIVELRYVDEALQDDPRRRVDVSYVDGVNQARKVYFDERGNPTNVVLPDKPPLMQNIPTEVLTEAAQSNETLSVKNLLVAKEFGLYQGRSAPIDQVFARMLQGEYEAQKLIQAQPVE